MTFRNKLLAGMTVLAVGTLALGAVLIVGSRLVTDQQQRVVFTRDQYDGMLNTVVLYQREVRQTEQRLLLTSDDLEITQSDLAHIRAELDTSLAGYLRSTSSRQDKSMSETQQRAHVRAEQMRALIGEFRTEHDLLFQDRDDVREMGNLTIEMLAIESDIGHPLAKLVEANTKEARQRAAQALASTENYVNTLTKLGLTIPVVLLGAVVLFLVALLRSFGRSMRELRAGTLRIAANELDDPVKLKTRDEFGQLADDVNHMAHRLLKAQEERAARFMLEEKAAALAAANRELEEFAYIAAHDLTSPLRGIDNLAAWIDEDAGDALTGESRSNLDLLRKRVRNMTNMLDDMLAYAVAGQAKAAPEQVDVGELLDGVIDLLSPPDGFEITVAGDMPTLQTVRSPLQEVLSNLIDNALKHHDLETGTITITANERAAVYKFCIADDGPGIAKRHHKKVFRMFQRLQATRSGTGLGLAFVRRTVEAYGGRIWIAQSEQQRGTHFCFTWPRIWSKPVVDERPTGDADAASAQ